MAELSLSEINARLRRPDQWEPAITGFRLAFCLSSGHSQNHGFSWALFVDDAGKRAMVRGAAFGLHVMGQLVTRLGGGGTIAQQTLIDEGLLHVHDVPMMHFTAQQLTHEVANLRLPVVGMPTNDGVDLESHHLFLDAGAAVVALTWGGSGPPSWKPLSDWALKTRAYLHNLTDPDEPLY
jgi:hypothetical protein